jgi:hypothetical protein
MKWDVRKDVGLAQVLLAAAIGLTLLTEMLAPFMKRYTLLWVLERRCSRRRQSE